MQEYTETCGNVRFPLSAANQRLKRMKRNFNLFTVFVLLLVSLCVISCREEKSLAVLDLSKFRYSDTLCRRVPFAEDRGRIR